jgi:hypothetical protein
MHPDQGGTSDGSYEVRTYTLRVGAMAEAVKLYQELGFPGCWACRNSQCSEYLAARLASRGGSVKGGKGFPMADEASLYQ